MISQILAKVVGEKVDHLIIVTPVWHNQLWYVQLLCMPSQSPLLLTQNENLLVNPLSQMHHLIIKYTLRLAPRKVFGRALDCKEFQAKLPNLHQNLGRRPVSLFVVTGLDEYIKRTSTLRENQNTSQLLLSTISPHKPVVSSTILGWVKKVLRKAGNQY